jgi:hypothetical protein
MSTAPNVYSSKMSRETTVACDKACFHPAAVQTHVLFWFSKSSPIAPATLSENLTIFKNYAYFKIFLWQCYFMKLLQLNNPP